MNLFNEDALREIIRDEIRATLRQELGKKPAASGEFVSVADAAQIASVAQQTIRVWIRGGKLKRYNAGRVYRVRRTELEALLASPPGNTEGLGREVTPQEEARRFVDQRISRQG